MVPVDEVTSTCTYGDCYRLVKAAGLCHSHYNRKKAGCLDKPIRGKLPRGGTAPPCTFDGCAKLQYSRKFGLCAGHYEHQRRGRPLVPLTPRRPTNANALRDKNGRKLCAKCRTWQTADNFYGASRAVDGLNDRCKECVSAYLVKRAFGITREHYLRLLDGQGGVCAICHKPDPTGKSLAVDHDHSCCPDRTGGCGECVRGLLCWSCNTAIGNMGDDPTILRSAAAYLERSR